MFASILQCSKSYHCDTLDPNHQTRISFRLPVTFHNVCLSPTCAVLDHGPQSRNLDKQLRTCYWLVVSTHLQKYESNWTSFPIFGVKIKKIFELPPASRSPWFLFSSFFPTASQRLTPENFPDSSTALNRASTVNMSILGRFHGSVLRSVVSQKYDI